MSNAGQEPIHLPSEGEIFWPIGPTPTEADEAVDDSHCNASNGPSNAELLNLADRFPAPQEWYDE